MENANEVFTAYSDRKLAKKILSHGCHCAMLSPVVGTYTEVRELGGAPIDALDALCRDFIQSRRCLVKSGGSCEDTGPGEVYEIGMIKNGDIYTGQCENNNTKTCSGAACMIDRFLADQTRNLDIDWRNFEPVKDAVCMKNFDNTGKNSCCGAWPNMALYNSATEKCVAGEIKQIE